MTRRPPVYGVTRCPGCRLPFTNAAGQIAAELYRRPVQGKRWVETSRGNFRTSYYDTTELWHAACWQAEVDRVEQLNRRLRADQLAEVVDLLREHGGRLSPANAAECDELGVDRAGIPVRTDR